MATEAGAPERDHLAASSSDAGRGSVSPQLQACSSANGSRASLPMFPMMYQAAIPGLLPQFIEQNDHGPGIYAVSYNPMGPTAPSTLIPLSYKIPTTDATGAAGEGEVQEARRQNGPPRMVVRRFHFAFQLDLGLILKLALLVFLFSQEGSRKRLIGLVLFASLVYLYRTGILGPLMRWIRRGVPPPRQLHPQAQHIAQQENIHPNGQNGRIDGQPEDNPGGDNQQMALGADNPRAGNVNPGEPARVNGINWWGIVKEIQTFVVGFVTSLFPGFHHQD